MTRSWCPAGSPPRRPRRWRRRSWPTVAEQRHRRRGRGRHGGKTTAWGITGLEAPAPGRGWGVLTVAEAARAKTSCLRPVSGRASREGSAGTFEGQRLIAGAAAAIRTAATSHIGTRPPQRQLRKEQERATPTVVLKVRLITSAAAPVGLQGGGIHVSSRPSLRVFPIPRKPLRGFCLRRMGTSARGACTGTAAVGRRS